MSTNDSNDRPPPELWRGIEAWLPPTPRVPDEDTFRADPAPAMQPADYEAMLARHGLAVRSVDGVPVLRALVDLNYHLPEPIKLQPRRVPAGASGDYFTARSAR